ncbi:four helix bundle protein [Flavisolibacter ginsenosidimutans]|nr:four helix bundle protein [Flavisolibacter ginsenosidimutans]
MIFNRGLINLGLSNQLMQGTYSLKSFDIFELSKKLVLACYALTGTLPSEEKTALTQYIRHAALSAHISIAQGAFLKKKKARKKFLQDAKNALLIIDAAVDVLVEAGLVKAEETNEVQQLSSTCYQLLGRLKKEN